MKKIGPDYSHELDYGPKCYYNYFSHRYSLIVCNVVVVVVVVVSNLTDNINC